MQETEFDGQQQNVDVSHDPRDFVPSESPMVLAQMKEMFKQQEMLQEQSHQVQSIIQQIREEQSELKQYLEQKWKQQDQVRDNKTVVQASSSSADATSTLPQPPFPQQPVPQPPPQQSSNARHLHDLPQPATVAEYTEAAQQDLQALKDLEVNGCHVSDGIFRGTPAQLESDTMQQGITRAEAALLHRAGMGSMLLPNTSLPTKVSVDLERNDARTVNTVLIQFVSIVPCQDLVTDRKLSRCYMRFQFFDLRPSETPVYMLEKLQNPAELRVSTIYCRIDAIFIALIACRVHSQNVCRIR